MEKIIIDNIDKFRSEYARNKYYLMQFCFTAESQLRVTGNYVHGLLHDREYDKRRFTIGSLNGIRRGWPIPRFNEYIEMGRQMAVEAPMCHVPIFIGSYILKTKSCKVAQLEELNNGNEKKILEVYLELPEDAEWVPNESFTPPSWNFGDPYEPEESYRRTQLKALIYEYENVSSSSIVEAEIERRKAELETNINENMSIIPSPTI